MSSNAQDTAAATQLWHAETMRPSQFFATLRRQAPRKKGEYQLLIAILKDAVDCFLNQRNRHLFEDAARWIMGEEDPRAVRNDDRAPTFSFGYICEVLDIDAEYLRSGLRRRLEGRESAGRSRHSP